jgi:pimeloyl-ACP methyl ester carboxylesterase
MKATTLQELTLAHNYARLAAMELIKELDAESMDIGELEALLDDLYGEMKDPVLPAVEKLGPAVVLAHSQGGLFAFRAAQALPAKVRALVLIEPSGFGESTPEALAALRDIPVLALYGDFIDQDARWPQIRQRGLDFYSRLRAAGGSVDVIALPERGIAGNSHMMMMDRNNRAVAQLVQDWLAAKGLWE